MESLWDMANLKTDRRDPLSMPILLRQTTTALLDMFVPASCLACDRAVGSASQLCGACWQRLQFIEKPYCRVLGTPFAYESSGGQTGWQTVSLAALAEPPDFDHCRSVGLNTLRITPEFGPPPYVPTVPFTGEPVTDVWQANVAMRDLLRTRLS